MGGVIKKYSGFLAALAVLPLFASCADLDAPGARTPDIPPAVRPLDRTKAMNEGRDAVVRVPLGKDVLVPEAMGSDPLPDAYVGPFELRGETLASALQMILDDYDISLAFENDTAMTQRITVANLRGNLGDVVDQACSLAGLYCSYRNGQLTVKATENFIVDLPPIGNSDAFSQIAAGINVFLDSEATVDTTTRVMIYSATQQQQQYIKRYFERLRKTTALIVFETHIWEVTLSNENRTGINWEAALTGLGNFDFELGAAEGGIPTGTASPITITPTWTGSSHLSSEMVFEFISEQGAVKTVSQPQLAVLSGTTAELTVQQAENFVSELSRTEGTGGDPDTVSTTTNTVQTGLEMSITSAWDQSTVYGTLDISLDELIGIDEFEPDANSKIQLPRTTNRSIRTQIRVRPGDTILIAGLVTEKDNYDASGPGLKKPILDTSRKTSTQNTELVFLLRPRVVAFVPEENLAESNGSIARAVSSMFGDEKEGDGVVKEKAGFSDKELSLGSIPAGDLAPVSADETAGDVP